MASMKNSRLFNSHVISVLSRLGHGDILAITDYGFPFPMHDKTKSLDLAISENVPGFLDVVELIMDECVVEGAFIAEETAVKNPTVQEELVALLHNKDKTVQDIDIRTMPHAELKNLVLHGAEKGSPVVAMLRTGECTPFANILFVIGVPF